MMGLGDGGAGAVLVHVQVIGFQFSQAEALEEKEGTAQAEKKNRRKVSKTGHFLERV